MKKKNATSSVKICWLITITLLKKTNADIKMCTMSKIKYFSNENISYRNLVCINNKLIGLLDMVG